MYYSFLPSIKDIIPFTNILKEGKECSLIEESLGSFSNQMEITEEIIDVFKKMIDNNVNEIETHFNIDGKETKFKLKIEKKILSETKAEISTYGDKVGDEIMLDYFLITLKLSLFDSQLTLDQLKQIASKALSHELGHANIISKRIYNKQNINTVELYGVVQKILNNANVSPIVNFFAYALYACYYEEKQAIVSSTSAQLLEKYSDDRIRNIKEKTINLTEDEKYKLLLKIYKKDLINTEAYQTFYTIFTSLRKSLTNQNKNLIKTVFRNYGLSIDVDNEIKQISKISKEALKDVTRNGTLFFYNFLMKI